VLAISTEHSFPQWLGIGKIMQGWCLGAMGQASEGIPLFLQGLDTLRPTGLNLSQAFFVAALAEVYGITGQPEEGLRRLTEAAELAETLHERWFEPEMHRLRGILLLARHEEDAAEESYRLAIAVAQRQEAKFWELHAATSLAGLWRDQGKRTNARELLAPIYNWFTEGSNTPALRCAKALLDQLA
jgi:predicted ATPase